MKTAVKIYLQRFAIVWEEFNTRLWERVLKRKNQIHSARNFVRSITPPAFTFPCQDVAGLLVL